MPGVMFLTKDHDCCVNPKRPFCMFSSKVSRLRGGQREKGKRGRAGRFELFVVLQAAERLNTGRGAPGLLARWGMLSRAASGCRSDSRRAQTQRCMRRKRWRDRRSPPRHLLFSSGGWGKRKESAQNLFCSWYFFSAAPLQEFSRQSRTPRTCT